MRPCVEPPSSHAAVLELHVPTALTRFHQLRAALPGTAVHYAVKANPHPVLLRALVAAGSPASTWRARPRCRPASTPAPDADDLVYSNPIKLRADIVAAAELGRPAVRRGLARGDPQGGRGRSG